jgi:Family of unknown function (DUF5681)
MAGLHLFLFAHLGRSIPRATGLRAIGLSLCSGHISRKGWACEGKCEGHCKNRDARKQPVGRPFQPGQSGNPAGRPKGARSKLSESFLKALSEDFSSNGIEVIEKVRNSRPHEYLKIVAAVLPKQMQLEDLTPKRRAEDLTDDELASIATGNA